MAQYLIPTYKLEYISGIIISAMNKAKKIGFPLDLSWRVVAFSDDHSYVSIEVLGAPDKPIAIEGGWKFVGKIDRIKGTEFNIVRGPGNLEKYRKCDISCQHCGVNRYRTSGFVVENYNGNRMMVGTACVDDYLGVNCLSALESLAKIFEILNEIEDDSGERKGSGENFYDIDAVACITCAVAMSSGYVSAAKAEHGKVSTRQTVSSYLDMLLSLKPEYYKEAKEVAKKGAPIWETIGKTVPTVDTPGISDFEYNVAISLHLNYLTNKNIGQFIAWVAISTAKLFQEKEKKDRPQIVDRFIGNVGDKVEFNAEILGVSAKETQFGTSVMVRMRADTGESLLWFASGWGPLEKSGLVDPKNGIVAGIHPLKGTIKRTETHEKYGYQTTVTRVSSRS